MNDIDLPDDQPTSDVVFTFDFLCFDAVHGRAGQAVSVQAVSPVDAVQQFARSLHGNVGTPRLGAFFVAVKPGSRDGDNWNVYRVVPETVVRFPVSFPDAEQQRMIHAIQTGRIQQ